MNDPPPLSDLLSKAEENRLDFLRTDLDLCFTFADLAVTELGVGDREAAHRVLGKAEDGYATILRPLAGVRNVEGRSELENKLSVLRSRLDDGKKQVQTSS